MNQKKYILVWRKQNNMIDKLKNGNSLETQIWSDEVKIDPKSKRKRLII